MCVVTGQLICPYVLASARIRFSDGGASITLLCIPDNSKTNMTFSMSTACD